MLQVYGRIPDGNSVSVRGVTDLVDQDKAGVERL